MDRQKTALIAVLMVVALLLAACADTGGSSASAPAGVEGSSRPDSSAVPQSLTSQPASVAASVPQSIPASEALPESEGPRPSANVAAQPKQGGELVGARWVTDLYLEYDEMQPVFNLNVNDNGTVGFVCAKTEYWTLLTFDGEVLYDEQENSVWNSDPVSICSGGCAHGLPPTENDGDPLLDRLVKAGFHYQIKGGHGTSEVIPYYRLLENGEVVFVERFNTVLPVYPYYAEVDSQVEPPHPWYDDDFEKFGLMSQDGEVLTPLDYDGQGMEECGYYFTNGFYALQPHREGNWEYYSTETLQLISEDVYEPMYLSHGDTVASPGFFNEGYCPVKRDGLYGFIDETGAEVVPPQFDGATHVYGGKAWVKQDGLWGQIEILG